MTSTEPPRTHSGDFADPPKALTPLCLMPNWVAWRWQPSADGRGWTKPPFRAADPDRHAANNDPSTWSTRPAAVAAVLAGKADGTGFVLTNTEIAAVDLDKCRDPDTGKIDAWAQEIMDAAPEAYAEVTVSGTGLRIIGIATGPETHRRFSVAGREGAGIEIYRRAVRYITVSGLQIGECVELPNIDKLIDEIAAEYDAGGKSDSNSNAGADAGGNGFDDIDGLIKHGAPEGARSEAFARCVWSLAGQGLSENEIEEELGRYPDGIGAKYGKRLRREIYRCYAKWQQHSQSGTAGASSSPPHSWDEPDISILDDRRGGLPDFPVDVFTPAWQEWLRRAAHGAGVRPEHVAVPLLGVASSLIGTARRVCASRSWFEPITLWTCVVADSGDRKTPGLRVATRALDLIETNNAPGNRARRLAHETKVQHAKEIKERWKKDREAALKETPPKEPPVMPLDAVDPGNLIEPRLYATDPTIERLAALLQARPRGMMLIRDELSGLFANMARYNKGGNDRPFWLEAFNGGRHVVERVTAGSTVIDHLLVGVIGTFQPDKLARAFAGDEDGMYGRFLYGWPLAPEYRPLTNEAAEVEPELLNALTALIRLPSEDETGIFAPQPIWLSQEAIAEFEEFRKWSDQFKRGLDGRERHWFVKGETHVLRLAGVLSYMAWAIALGTSSANGLDAITASLEPKTIDKKFVADAIRLWRDFFWPHARAAMRQIGLTDRHKNARRVLRWIIAHNKREFSREEIRQNALGKTLDARQTTELLVSLEKAGWVKGETIKTAGRPRLRWVVNPKLFADDHPESPETPERSFNE
jgi:Protein of unknown function (DUF3987)